MLNTSNVAHSILAEEVDNCNSNNNNNNSLLLNDLSFHNDDIITNGSLHYGVYDTTVFDVLKVDPEDFAVSIVVFFYLSFEKENKKPTYHVNNSKHHTSNLLYC